MNRPLTAERPYDIGLRATQWIWLVLNLLWLNGVVPSFVVVAATTYRDAAAVTKVVAAITLVAVIPFVGVLAFALLSYWLLKRVERALLRPGAPGRN